jgi:hypothetical protein
MMQVFNRNFLDEALSASASSADSSYPASNVYNLERRRKTWRSAGYWKVVSGSNTIVFREVNAGADLTATVAAGAYSSDSAFRTAVAAALTAASTHGATYTCTRDTTTNMLKLTQSASGTASAFQIRGPSATALLTAMGFDSSLNQTGAIVYYADELKIHTEEFFLWDLGAPGQPTGLIAVGDRNSPLNISPGATVKLMGSPTNSWDAPAETFTLTLRDFLLGYLNADGIAQSNTAGYRYWKLQIIDASNPDGYVELGAIFLGTHVSLDRGAPAFPYASKEVDNSLIDFSESGQTWVGKKPGTKIHTVEWEKLTSADAEALEDVWDTYGKHSSFFIALDPSGAFTVDGTERTRLVKFSDEPELRLTSPGNWSYHWVLREEL